MSDLGVQREVPSDAVEAIEESAPEVGGTRSEDGDWIGLGGDESLTWKEADRVAAGQEVTIVLLAGNQGSGKTTLLVQLWAQFLRGPFAGYRFAGSETLDAFDSRHFPCRESSGNSYPETVHTADTDMRFLHLRVANASGERQALLITDLWGELFESVALGAKPAERVPVAPRADKTIVVIDGQEVSDVTRREATLRNARTLIGSLASEGGLRLDAPLMVLLSKADAVGAKDLEWYGSKATTLLEFALGSGFTTVAEHRVAARPPGADPEGLEGVIAWVCNRHQRVPIVEPERTPRSGRVFTTGRMGTS